MFLSLSDEVTHQSPKSNQSFGNSFEYLFYSKIKDIADAANTEIIMFEPLWVTKVPKFEQDKLYRKNTSFNSTIIFSSV